MHGASHGGRRGGERRLRRGAAIVAAMCVQALMTGAPGCGNRNTATPSPSEQGLGRRPPAPENGATIPPQLPPPPPRIEPPIERVPRAEGETHAPEERGTQEVPAQEGAGSHQAAARPGGMRELFPHVRADVAQRVVEFDGVVPINCHDPDTPQVFLEVTVCTPDTKEYETLVVTPARPSHVHAALLAVGLKPGAPGAWKWEEKKLIPIAPRGDPVEVTIAYTDGAGREVEAPASEWVKMADTGGRFAPKAEGARWVFAGSVFAKHDGEEVYDADGAGTLIGLTTFASETVAWVDTLSPESSVQDPDWIADPEKVPKLGTPVVVRIRAVK